MLRITADVNGRPIERIYIHNTGKKPVHLQNSNFYTYDAAMYNEETGAMVLGIEHIVHSQTHDWKTLLNKVLRRVKEKW